MESFQRVLSVNCTGLNETNSTGAPCSGYTDDNTESPQGQEQDVFQFMGFLAWYILLVICCVVPPCIAYRRRRLMERRLTHQAYLQRMMAANGMILMGDHRFPEGHEVLEQLRMERSRRILEALKPTTRYVKEQDLIKIEDTLLEDEEKGEKENPDTIESTAQGPPDLGACALDDENCAACVGMGESTVLQLGDVPNGNRQVPGACAICLCPYEAHDSVCNSPNEHCIHAFHTECAVTWLSKKDQTLCPCCRQDFCTIEPIRALQIEPHELTNGTPF